VVASAGQTRRSIATAFLIVAIACTYVLVFAGTASAHWTHSNSSCTGQEDPANFMVPTPDHWLIRLIPTGNATAVGPAYGAANLARHFWNGGLGSTDSWFLFDSANGGCRDQTDYATNSITSGNHIRFWQGSQAWPYNSSYSQAWGAAHHDFLCGTSHSSNNYASSAAAMSDDWVAWRGDGINIYPYPFFSYTIVQDRAPASGVHCGLSWSDAGNTWHLLMLNPSVLALYD